MRARNKTTKRKKDKKKDRKRAVFLFEVNSAFAASVKTRKYGKNFICRVKPLSKNTRERYFAECAVPRERCIQGRKVSPPQLRLLFCRVARGNFVGQRRQRERILHYGRSCDGIAAANYAGAIVWRSRVGRNVVILQFVFTADTIRPVFRESKSCSLFRGLLLLQMLTKERK